MAGWCSPYETFEKNSTGWDRDINYAGISGVSFLRSPSLFREHTGEVLINF